jgi:hypothetical protein
VKGRPIFVGRDNVSRNHEAIRARIARWAFLSVGKKIRGYIA